MQNTNYFLMVDARYFCVNYIINPWMKGHINNVNQKLAKQQWQDFHDKLSQLVGIHLIDPQPQFPDFVFTANAGLVKDKKVILSHFRHPERQQEEPFYKQWFENNGYTIYELPDTVYFEGEGDALFQPDMPLLWVGYGLCSDYDSIQYIKKYFNTFKVVSLNLIDERFYHLDTCFCPLLNSEILYYPKAFNAQSNKTIEKTVPEEKRIIVNDDDALNFACNAVCIKNIKYEPKNSGGNSNNNPIGFIVINQISQLLRTQLESLGYSVLI